VPALKLPTPWPADPPPGPFRKPFWDSPLRGPWLTAIFGSLLLIALSVVALTGFGSHAAYNPELGRNALFPNDLPLTFDWPSSPAWLYGLNQGLHVNVGLAAIPLLLAKLWSVIPRLFAWPPVASPAEAIERVAIALLVSSSVFLFATGVANAQYWYPFGFNFVIAHYYAAVIFVAALASHVAVKMPVVVRAYRERGVLKPLRDDLAHTHAEPVDRDGLVAEVPAPATITRRGVLGLVGGASALLVVGNAGQSIGGPLRDLAWFAPRRNGGFPVNKTARLAQIKPEMVNDSYALVLQMGDRELRLSRAQLLELGQRTETLPIACVEGWTSNQTWTGVPLAELARMAGAGSAGELQVGSLQPKGVLRQATLSRDQFRNDRSLLALKVNGKDLSMDHGYPGRIIVPALPGVHNTKWVGTLKFV
jgi:DMSO/TMAO reductase YedYZ molybdopterin-dependent catalytic subunit